MDSYELNFCGLKRKLPLIPIGEDRAYASFVILGDVELVSLSASELAKRDDILFLDKLPLFRKNSGGKYEQVSGWSL